MAHSAPVSTLLTFMLTLNYRNFEVGVSLLSKQWRDLPPEQARYEAHVPQVASPLLAFTDDDRAGTPEDLSATT